MTVSSHLILHFALAFLASFIASWLAVRWLITYLARNNIVDSPNERSMHSGDIPRGGGLVIAGAVLLCLLILAVTGERPQFFGGLALCIGSWAALSWSDDKFDLSPKLRFSIQIAIASLTVVLFGWVDRFVGIDLAWAGPVFSVFGLLWLANLNNFMDGMDGLAASQAIIGSLTFTVWFAYLGDWQLATVCITVVAASYGFLLWNWQPAKIFMGDVGSISLGALYATLIIIAANRHQIPVFSLLLIFAVFIGDATFTIINRIRKGEKFWLPHRSHFYQRAGLAGVKHANVVLVAIIMMALCSVFATLSVLYRDTIALLGGVTLVMLSAAGYWVVMIEKRSAKRHQRSNTDTP